MAEQQPQPQPGDRMSMDDHASAIDQALAEHYDEDFRPLGQDDDGRETEDDAPQGRDDRSEDSPRRRRQRDQEEARDEDDDGAGAEDDEDKSDSQADEQLDEDAEDDLEDDAEGDQDDEADSDEIKTLADLAEALDKQPEEVMEGLTLQLEDGEEVTLAELRAGHMRERDYRQKTEEVATQRRAVSDREAKLSETAQDAVTVNQQLLGVMKQALVRQMDSPQMERLRAEKPADYLLAKEEAGRKLEALNQAQQRAAEHLTKLKNEAQQKQAAELQEYVADQREQLVGKLGALTPERRQAIKDFAQSTLGFAAEEFGTVLDHRYIVAFSMLMDAQAELATLRASGAEKREQAEKGTRRGRLRKRGRRGGKGRGSPSKETRAQADQRRAMKRAKETGGVKEAAAAIKNLI